MSLQVNGMNNFAQNSVAAYARNKQSGMNYATNPMEQNKPYVYQEQISVFDNKLDNAENMVKYNAMYLESYEPMDFNYNYMKPNSKEIDRHALLETAKEEMGADEMSVEDFEEKYLVNDNQTAKPLDINNDGKITAKEYAANILASDILSKDNFDINGADGNINEKGFTRMLAITTKLNASAAAKLYGDIYKNYDLEALK